MREYDYPVFATQGGGLAREANGMYIFVEKPDCPGLDVGDEVPKEWDIQPANPLAIAKDEQQMEDDDPFLSAPDRAFHLRPL